MAVTNNGEDVIVSLGFSEHEQKSIVIATGQVIDHGVITLKIEILNVKVTDINNYFPQAYQIMQSYLQKINNSGKEFYNSDEAQVITSFTRIPAPMDSIYDNEDEPRLFLASILIELISVSKWVAQKTLQQAIDAMNIEIAQAIRLYNNNLN